jgi:hypothetical protein
VIAKFRSQRSLERKCKVVKSVFDEAWYMRNNPDVSESDFPAIEHYLLIGAFELRSPHILFDEAWYVDRNPDVKAAKIPGLLHYMLWGSKEGRSPHPLIAESWIKENAGNKAGSCTAIEFLLNSETSDVVNPHPLFDAMRYRSKYMRSEVSSQQPIAHYLETGFRLMNNPHPLFSEQWYQENYPDVKSLDVAGLVHYVKHGHIEGRSPHPLIDPMKLQSVLVK